MTSTGPTGGMSASEERAATARPRSGSEAAHVSDIVSLACIRLAGGYCNRISGIDQLLAEARAAKLAPAKALGIERAGLLKRLAVLAEIESVVSELACGTSPSVAGQASEESASPRTDGGADAPAENKQCVSEGDSND